MKHANARKETIPDYASPNFQPCWTCKKAVNGCIWSKRFDPVPGWKAEKTIITGNGEPYDSYKISYCPEYEKEERGSKNEKGI
jgi:hypothetical protein